MAKVRYPGLESFAINSQAKCQMRGYGGMLGFRTVPDVDREKFKSSLQLCKPWVSLGDVEALVVATAENKDKGIPTN